MKPRLLDLFCGAGGAAMGYSRAGFEVVGVDIVAQPHYPFEFIQDDALFFAAHVPVRFDAIHASPPCQHYSFAARLNPGSRDKHPDLIARVRELLLETGLPYVIENVEGARAWLRNPYLLCGSMVGIEVRRHRLFECSFPMLVPSCHHDLELQRPQRYISTTTSAGTKRLRGIVNAAATGSNENMANLKRAMGVTWMVERRGITEAIPPAYTELIGAQLLQHIESERAA